jgi:hypothetical protein
MQILAGIDLANTEIARAILENLDVAPLSPARGYIYFDTVLGCARVWSGTTWDSGGGSLLLSDAAPATVTGTAAVGVGTSAARDDHAHAVDASSGTALREAIDDAVAGLLVAGGNVSLSYSDAAGTLTISVANYPAVSGLTTGQSLRATAAGAVAYGPLDLANANAITGDLPDANLSANVPLLNASNVFSGASQTVSINANSGAVIGATNANNTGTAAYAQLRADLGSLAFGMGVFSTGITGALADYAGRTAVEANAATSGISFTVAGGGAATFDIRTGGRADANRRLIITSAGAVLIGKVTGFTGAGDLDVAGSLAADGDLYLENDNAGIAYRLINTYITPTDHFTAAFSGYTWATDSGVFNGAPSVVNVGTFPSVLLLRNGTPGQNHFAYQSINTTTKTIYARMTVSQECYSGIRIDSGGNTNAMEFRITEASGVMALVARYIIGGVVTTTTLMSNIIAQYITIAIQNDAAASRWYFSVNTPYQISIGGVAHSSITWTRCGMIYGLTSGVSANDRAAFFDWVAL